MKYADALAQSEVDGCSHAKGDALLALSVWGLSQVHRINPELVYESAKRKGMTGRELRRLDAVALGGLMFD